MGHSPMGRSGGSGNYSTSHSDFNTQEIFKNVNILRSPSASAMQKTMAKNALLAQFGGNTHLASSYLAQMHVPFFFSNDGTLMYSGGGAATPAGNADGSAWTTGVPGGSAAPQARAAAGQNKWSQAQQALTTSDMGQDRASAPVQGNAGTNQTYTYDPNTAAPWETPTSAGGTGSNSLPTAGGSGQSVSGIGGTANQGGFFGGVQGEALNEVNNSPDAAWQLYLQQGGQGGSPLANSSASTYGADDFQSAMALAPYIGGAAGPTSNLDFTQGVMDRSSGANGAGQYIDPGKLFNATMSSLAGKNVSDQEQGIQTLEKQMGTYMDSTQYQMLKNRIDQVMRQYMVQGLKNPNQDQSDMLLKMVQQAAGF